MIKNVIFDLGGVMLQFRFSAFCRDHGLEKKHVKTIEDLVFNNPEWAECDLGYVSSNDEVVRKYCDSHNVDEEFRKVIIPYWQETIGLKKNMPEYLKSLKERGYEIYILSNLSEEMLGIHEKHDFYQYVDGGVYSFREHLLKPDPRIYEALLSRYDLKAEECLFIDDRKENVQAARKLGMKAVRFRHYREARSKAEKYL